MPHRGGPSCFLLALALAGCQNGAQQNSIRTNGPSSTDATPAAFHSGPARTCVVAFVRPGRDVGVAHIVVPVSLNDGPPRAFILDTGAPVTTVLIAKHLLDLSTVARKLDAAHPTRIQGISGASSTAYRVTARSIAVGPTRLAPFPYVLMSSDRDLADLGDTPYGSVVGILGNDFLSRYRVTVDYQSRTVSLEER